MFLIINRGRPAQRDDSWAWIILTLLLPAMVAVAGPYIWWVWSRDAGHDRWTSAYHTLAIVILAAAGALYVGWWMAPLVLLAGGLVGLVAIDHDARAEYHRELEEREREERDWRNLT